MPGRTPEVMYRHYEPRQGVKEEIDRLLREAVRDLPTEAEVRLVVVDAGDRYTFSAVATIGRAIFSSDVTVLKSEARGRERHWQMEPTARCLRDLILQVNRFGGGEPKGSA